MVLKIDPAKVSDMYYKDLMTVPEIAACVECSQNSVVNLIKKHRGSFEKLGNTRKGQKVLPYLETDWEGNYTNPELHAKILRMYFEDGIDQYHIHKQVGIRLEGVIEVISIEKNKGKTLKDFMSKVVYYDHCEVCFTPFDTPSRNKTCGKRCANILRRESRILSDYEKDTQRLKCNDPTNI